MADRPDTDAIRQTLGYMRLENWGTEEAEAELDRLEARLSEAERRAETAEYARSHLGELNTVERDRTRRAEARLSEYEQALRAAEAQLDNEYLSNREKLLMIRAAIGGVARAALSGNAGSGP